VCWLRPWGARTKVKIQGDYAILLRCRLLRRERNVGAQGFEAPHQAALDGLPVTLVEIGGSQVGVSGVPSRGVYGACSPGGGDSRCYPRALRSI
jgi:hypothetical protein